jgi:predicted ester cyclase
MFYAAFPDYTHVIDDVVAEGDWVAVRLTFHATHQGEFQGIPATGNTVTYGGAHFGRLVDGRIAEWWILENDLGLMEQIGVDLAPVETEETGG